MAIIGKWPETFGMQRGFPGLAQTPDIFEDFQELQSRLSQSCGKGNLCSLQGEFTLVAIIGKWMVKMAAQN